MAGLEPSDIARLREKAEQLNHQSPHALPKITPQNIESLVHELRIHQIELELQCQELQRAQVEVEESRNRYRELYESIPIGYLTVDLSGRIHDLNPAGASLLGVGREGKFNNFFSFFFSSDDSDAVLIFFRRILDNRTPGSLEVKMKHFDGSVIVGALQAVPVERGEGKGEHLRVAFRDVTARKKIEDSLRLHQMELESNRVELQDLMAKLFTAQE